MWKLLWPGIAMIAVTYAFARFSYGLFLPDITSSIGLTTGQAGIAGSAAYFSYTMALLTSSFFVSRFGERRVIQFAGLSAVAGLLGIAFSYNIYVLVCSTFIAGLGSGWASPAFGQVATTLLKKEDSERGNTWINTGTSFGIILSGPIALLIAEQWRLAFIWFALISVAVLIWNSISIPVTERSGSAQKIFSKSLFKKAKFLIFSALIIGFVSSVFWTFSRKYVSANHDMSNKESFLFWVLMGASGIAGGVAGKAINRAGLGISYRAAMLLMAISVAIITIPNAWAIYLSAILFGVTYIFLTGLLIVWSARIFPKMASLGVSLAFLSLGIGQSLGSGIGGELISITSYTFTFLLYASVCLLGLLVRMKKESEREGERI